MADASASGSDSKPKGILKPSGANKPRKDIKFGNAPGGPGLTQVKEFEVSNLGEHSASESQTRTKQLRPNLPENVGERLIIKDPIDDMSVSVIGKLWSDDKKVSDIIKQVETDDKVLKDTLQSFSANMSLLPSLREKVIASLKLKKGYHGLNMAEGASERMKGLALSAQKTKEDRIAGVIAAQAKAKSNAKAKAEANAKAKEKANTETANIPLIPLIPVTSITTPVEKKEEVNVASENNNSVVGIGNEDLEEPIADEIDEPAPINATGNMLLRIGDDQTSEYIHLNPKEFKTASFNMAGLAIGTKEFKDLYRVQTSQQYKIMQRVFGVPRMFRKPLFYEYLEKECVFDGFIDVKIALESRIRSLKQQIQLEGATNLAKRYTHQLEWLEKTLEKMATFKAPCPSETANASVGTNATITGTGSGTGSGSSNCPCLTDINLLRDLVYVMAVVQERATPEVQTQLDAIPFQKIVNAAKKNSSKNMYSATREALLMLLDLVRRSKVNKQNKTTANIPSGLNSGSIARIYKILNPTGNATNIDFNSLVLYLEELKKKVDSCSETQSKVDDLNQQLAAKQAELDLLRKIKTNIAVGPNGPSSTNTGIGPNGSSTINTGIGPNGSSTTNTGTGPNGPSGTNAGTSTNGEFLPMENVQQAIQDLSKQIEEYEAELAELRSQLKQKDGEKNASNAAATSLKGNLEKSIKDGKNKNTTISNLTRRLEIQMAVTEDADSHHDADAKLLEDEIERIRGLQEKAEADLEQLHKQLTDEQGSSRAKDAELQTLRDQHAEKLRELEKAQKEYTDLQEKLAGLEKEGVNKNSKKTALEGEHIKLAKELEDARKQIGDLSGEKDGLEGKIVALEAELEGQKNLVSALEGEKGNLRTQLAEIQSLSQGKSKNLNAATSALAKAKDDASRLEREIEAIQSQLTSSQDDLQRQLADLSVQLAESKSKEAAKSAELDSLRIYISELEEKAARVNSAEGKSKTLEESLAAERAALKECTDKLAQSTTSTTEQIQTLTKELEDARQAVATAEADSRNASSKSSSEQSRLQSELDAAQSRVQALESELAGLRTSGSNATTAFEETRKKLEARITDLEAELGSQKTSMNSEKSVAIETERKQCEDRIKEITTRIVILEKDLADAKTETQQVKAKANANTASAATKSQQNKEASDTRITELESELQSVRGELANAIAARDAADAAKLSISSELDSLRTNIDGLRQRNSGKNAELTDLRQRLATAETDLAAKQSQCSTLTNVSSELKIQLEKANDLVRNLRTEIATLQGQLAKGSENASGKNAEIARLKTALSSAEAALEAKNRNSKGFSAQLAQKFEKELGETEDELDRARSLIDGLEKQLRTLQLERESTIEAETKKRLETILAAFTVSSDQKEIIQDVYQGKTDALAKIQQETCMFFKYLYDTINLQLRNIESLEIVKDDKYPQARTDILSIYTLPTAYKHELEFDQALLGELTDMFQIFFIRFRSEFATSQKGLELPKSKFPLIYSILGKDRGGIKDEVLKLVPAARLKEQLMKFGYLFTYGIGPTDTESNTLKLSIQPSNDAFIDLDQKYKFTPLTILAIRMIQLLHESFDRRYSELKAKCEEDVEE